MPMNMSADEISKTMVELGWNPNCNLVREWWDQYEITNWNSYETVEEAFAWLKARRKSLADCVASEWQSRHDSTPLKHINWWQ